MVVEGREVEEVKNGVSVFLAILIFHFPILSSDRNKLVLIGA